jgi:hypothetical protein
VNRVSTTKLRCMLLYSDGLICCRIMTDVAPSTGGQASPEHAVKYEPDDQEELVALKPLNGTGENKRPRPFIMADVAQLVRAPGCGSGGRGFETHHPPHQNLDPNNAFLKAYFWFPGLTLDVAGRADCKRT